MSQKDKVFSAADSISARGEPLTQIAIRAEMGGGSFSTIGPLLKEWKLANPATHRVIDDGDEAPENVQKVVSELVRRTWIEAKSTASVALEAMRQDVEDLKAETAAEIAETLDAMRVLEAERDDAQDRIQALRQSLDDATDHISTVDSALDAARDLAGVHAARADAAEREIIRADAAKIEADARTAVAIRERDAARAETDQARKDGAEAVAAERRAGADAAKIAQDETADLRETIAALREQVASLIAERSLLSDQVKAADAFREAVISLREQVAALTAERDALAVRVNVVETSKPSKARREWRKEDGGAVQ